MMGGAQDGSAAGALGFHAINPRDGYLSLEEFTARMEDCTIEQMESLMQSPEFKSWVQQLRYRRPARVFLRDNRISLAKLLLAFYVIITTTLLFLQTGTGQGALSTVVSREAAASVILSEALEMSDMTQELQELRKTEERMQELEYLLELSQVARQHKGAPGQPPSAATSTSSCRGLQAELRRAQEGAAAAETLVESLREEKAELRRQLGRIESNSPQANSSELGDEDRFPQTSVEMLLPSYGLSTGQQALLAPILATILLALAKPAYKLLESLVQRLPVIPGALGTLLGGSNHSLAAAEQAEMLAWQLDRVAARQDELAQASSTVQVQALQSLKASLGCALGMAAEERADLLKAIHSLEDSIVQSNAAEGRVSELQATVAHLEKEVRRKDAIQAKSSDLLDRSQATLERTLSEKEALCREMDHLREAREREATLGDKLVAKLRAELKSREMEAGGASQIRDQALEVLGRAQDELEQCVAENARLHESVDALEAERAQLQRELKLRADQLQGPKSHALLLPEPQGISNASDELARAWVRLCSAPAFVVLSLASMRGGTGAHSAAKQR